LYKNYIYNPDYKAENYSDLISSQAGQLVKCQIQEDFINKINWKVMNKWSNYGKWRHPKKRKELMKNIDIKNNNLDKQYQSLLQDILDNGVSKKDRTGTGTISVFGRQIRHKMSEGFPLLTTKKMAWKTMVVELLWFLRGDTNIKFLVDNNCHIWNGDAYRSYCDNYPDVEKTFQYEGSNIEVRKMTQEEFINQIKTDDEFAKKWGDLGPVYGKQWRSWNDNIDQISDLIKQLKENPDSRRLLLSAWNPSELDQMVLPPCHYGFQVYTRELSLEERLQVWNIKFGFTNEEQKNQFDPNVHLDTHGVPTRAISLMFNMRSTDVGLGLSFNLSSYGLLLMMIAKQVNMVPEELIYNGGDVHLYLNHIEPIKEQLTREPYELPTVKISDSVVNDISEYTLDDIILENYQSHPTIKMQLSN
jgi:thymidylate synthase